jgi:hypothetical protein
LCSPEPNQSCPMESQAAPWENPSPIPPNVKML